MHKNSTTLSTSIALLLANLTFLLQANVIRGESAPRDGAFRPPAVPLVTSDPYLSIWSEADRLTDDVTRHWTHRGHPLVSLIRVDGKAYRLMGNDPKEVPALPQVGLQVLPTRSIYDFDDGHVHVTLTFMTPALPQALDVLARPVTYFTWSVRSIDGASHAVAIYDSTSSLLSVNSPDQKVEWSRETAGSLTSLRVGTVAQTLLAPAGDDTRIDWGYAYVAAPQADSSAAIGGNGALLNTFIAEGKLPATDDSRMPRAAADDQPVLAFSFDLGKVGAEPVLRHLSVAYDEVFSIKLLGQKLRPYWRRNGASAADLLQFAERDYAGLIDRCEKFDRELMADLTKVGGARYAQIAALAYRQSLAGCGLAADANKQPLLFTKENTSNGCIATVDVIYPAAPQFLLMGPTYAKALVAPALVYSASPQWKFPFAPHDLGTYPQAKGQDYGGGENPGNEADKMPVEESANMILLCDAIAKMDGNADFASRWWPQLTQWVDYLVKHGIDPENQLCTDDFMGHLARNANLSVKAILGIAAYADLCRLRGEAAAAEKHIKLAKEGAAFWIKTAADGNHSRIAFDKANTWSQKYNLVWDKLLGLNVFPAKVAADEVAYYKTKIQPFGVPLDSRTHLTKTDWSLWCATLADNRADFETMVSPIYDYLNRTTARMPFVDSYITDNAASDGMHARPVIGGVFITMLSDPEIWKKWSDRDQAKAGNWAAAPTPPRITEVVPTSRQRGIEWRYSLEKPAGDWTKPGFDDSHWQSGPGGFGTHGTPNAVVGTVWNTADIWLRREASLPENADVGHLQLLVYHDEDVEIYIDGVLAGSEAGFVNSYDPMDISSAAKKLLKPGQKFTLAVHCHQTVGGQGVDVGLVEVAEADSAAAPAASAAATAPSTSSDAPARSGFRAREREVVDPVIVKIRDEGLNHSQVMATLDYLCDVIGQRLTGSPNAKRANDWTRGKLAGWGLTSARLESWGPFGRGWELKRFSLQVTKPQTIPLIAYPKAWTPGFDNPLEADVVWLDAKTEAELEKYKGKLKGMIVLADPIRALKPHFDAPGARMTDGDLLTYANSTGRRVPPAVQPPKGTSSTEFSLAAATSVATAPAANGSPTAATTASGNSTRGTAADSSAPATADSTSRANGDATSPAGGDPARRRFGNPFSGKVLSFCAKEEAALVLTVSPQGDGGTIFVASASVPGSDGRARGGPRPWSEDAPAMPPQVCVAVEDYNRMVRMVQQGEELKIAVDLQVQFLPTEMANNTIAEIAGSDLRDQVVMIGGHLDSWHAGTGATDNGAGVAVAMETVRILQAVGVKPRRTIRIGLWTGEEEGLLGSRAYVTQHFGTAGGTGDGTGRRGPRDRADGSQTAAAPAGVPQAVDAKATGELQANDTKTVDSKPTSDSKPGDSKPSADAKPAPPIRLPEHDKLSIYFNLDNGTGRIRGVFTQGNEAAMPLFRKWLIPFHDLGAETVSLASTGSTDHVSFEAVGLPGFEFMQDPIEYMTRSHHSNQDVFDRVPPDDLKQAAIIMAAFVYDAAMMEQRFPRKSSE